MSDAVAIMTGAMAGEHVSGAPDVPGVDPEEATAGPPTP